MKKMENISIERKEDLFESIQNNEVEKTSNSNIQNIGDFEDFYEDNTPNYENESIHSDIDVEIDNEIENEIQNKILNSTNQQDFIMKNNENENEKEDDFFNFSHTFIEEPRKQSYFDKYFNMFHNNSDENQNKRRNISSSFKTFTEEEKNEIFNKTELKLDLKPDDDEVFNIFLNDYQYKKNIVKEFEIIKINNNELSTVNQVSNENLIVFEDLKNDIDNFKIDDFYVKQRFTSYMTSITSNYSSNRNNKSGFSSSSSYNFNFNTNQNTKIKETKFDFFKCYENDDENEGSDENNPFDDCIKYVPRKEEYSDNESLNNMCENYSVNSEFSNTKDKIQGEISKIYYKTEEYFDKNCFSEHELIKNYDVIYEKCKPGEEYNNIFKRCVENVYFDSYFNAYFSKIFFKNICKFNNDSKESDEYIIDENLFNICLMDIVTKNIHPEHLLTRDLLKCYIYLFSFIEDIICHYYFNCEYDVSDAGSKSFEELQKMINDEKRHKYLTTKPIPGKYLMYLSMWLYSLTRKDIYLCKESVITNIYFLEFIFNELNLKTDYDSDIENDSDEESIKSISEPDFDELKMVNNNYEVEYDSFCL